MGVWSPCSLGTKIVSTKETLLLLWPKHRNLNLSWTPQRLSYGSRRSFGLGLSLLIWFCSPGPSLLTAMPQLQQERLDTYTDTIQGFYLLIPSSWVKVEKAGATVLFEDSSYKGNNVGVVVNPVRLNSLTDFGSPQFVADKLIQAERRKESTKEAEVIRVAERVGSGGLPVYEIEYKVDSTRGGMKRIFSAVFVTSRKLYLLNISYSDCPENPIDPKTRMMLEKILHSFDTVPSPAA